MKDNDIGRISKVDPNGDKNYRIYRVEPEDAKPCDFDFNKITMLRFHADSQDEAYDKLVEYRKVANKEYKYYVERWCGSTKERLLWKNRNVLSCIWSDICFYLEYYFIIKPMDVYYYFRDLFYLLKYKQEYNASWKIDEKLIDVLLLNIPILRKNKHSYSWAMLDKAVKEKHGNEKGFDITKYYYDNTPEKDVYKKAEEYEKEMFDELVKNIKLYRYYTYGYEYVDRKDKEAVEFDNQWRHTLPLVKGSFDSYDYKKLEKMSTKYWNKIFDTVMKYGREFND